MNDEYTENYKYRIEALQSSEILDKTPVGTFNKLLTYKLCITVTHGIHPEAAGEFLKDWEFYSI